MKSANVRIQLLVVCAAVLGMSTAALAHHGSANYDTTKLVSVKGTVTEFDFTNPHVLIFMQGKDEAGQAQKWQGELTSPNHLMRVGWTKSIIKPGDTVTISGYPAKSGSRELWIRKVVEASGDELPIGNGN